MNSEPIILHIETSTNVCSVALSKGEQLLCYKESHEDKAHGRLLTLFIDEVFQKSNTDISALDAVSVGKGPGSYTGLRIGVSVAKGICYAQNIPLIAIGTLEILTIEAINKLSKEGAMDTQNILYCPMLDARRMEVYTANYDRNFKLVKEICAEIIDENSFVTELDNYKVYFFGNGSDKCKEVISNENAIFIKEIFPKAENMIELSYQAFLQEKFEDVAYFEPYYLKEFVATVSKKKIL